MKIVTDEFLKSEDSTISYGFGRDLEYFNQYMVDKAKPGVSPLPLSNI